MLIKFHRRVHNEAEEIHVATVYNPSNLGYYIKEWLEPGTDLRLEMLDGGMEETIDG